MKENKPLVSIIIPTYNRKEKLVRLIYSIKRSGYPKDNMEIIVVDDASTDGTAEEISKLFPDVKLIRNEIELLLAGSRNVGIRNARGDYLFLIDDDNVIDRNCIGELVNAFENDASLGIVAPIMYYLKQSNRVWCAGIRRNMITSLTTYVGRNKIDVGDFGELIKSEDFPNAFMIKREVIEKVGFFNQKIFPLHYDEADFGERVSKAGYKIVCNPKAKVWHDIPFPEEVRDKLRLFHIHNRLRAYYAGRNRIVFHKKYSNKLGFLLFITIFNWLFALYYLTVIVWGSNNPFRERLKITKAYLKGVMDGIKWQNASKLQ